MENLLLSFTIVLPLFLSIMLGYFLRRIHFFGEDQGFLKKINSLVFHVFLPLMLFNNIYTTDLSSAFDAKLVIYTVIAVFALFFLTITIVPIFVKAPAQKGVVEQAIFRSNSALFGLPVAISLCGEDKLGPISILIGLIVPIFNMMAVIVLEVNRGGKVSPLHILKEIVTNPVIIASVLGILLNLLGVKFPAVIEKTIKDLGSVTSPLSLVALGGFLEFKQIGKNLKPLTVGVLGKLIISPLLFVSIGALIGFRNEYLAALLIMFGSPAAVASFTMAEQMGGDGELAAQLVVMTTTLSILSMFLWIFALKTLQLL